MSNSSLVNYTQISPNKTAPRNHKIDTITIHCFVGQVTVENGCACFAKTTRQASCNYVVAKDGKIGLVVDEKDRSWCSSNAANDHRAVTIEVASDTTHPYAVTDAAYNALINLCADICKRNGIKKMLWFADKNKTLNYERKVGEGCFTVHRWFAAKACPGDYLYNKHTDICNKVNAKIGATATTPATPVTNKEAFIKEVVKYVEKYREQYGIKVVSAIVGQACLESGYGTSELAVNAQNYFGLKHRDGRCKTEIGLYAKIGSEQKADGSYESSNMIWSKFKDLENSVIGYFDFTNISSYKNLKGVTDPKKYLENIKADQYATSIDYVDKVMRVINEWNLTQYDPKPGSATAPASSVPYIVKVDTPNLNIRKGPGTNYATTGKTTGIGKFTITEVKTGTGSKSGWGKLKSGAGWISLDYAERI